MMSWLRPRNWWHAGLLWGTAMFIYYVGNHAVRRELTLGLAAKDLLVWESGGLLFGLILTAVLSLLAHKNLFHGFPEKRGER
jgi:hypothetical protein